MSEWKATSLASGGTQYTVRPNSFDGYLQKAEEGDAAACWFLARAWHPHYIELSDDQQFKFIETAHLAGIREASLRLAKLYMKKGDVVKTMECLTSCLQPKQDMKEIEPIGVCHAIEVSVPYTYFSEIDHSEATWYLACIYLRRAGIEVDWFEDWRVLVKLISVHTEQKAKDLDLVKAKKLIEPIIVKALTYTHGVPHSMSEALVLWAKLHPDAPKMDRQTWLLLATAGSLIHKNSKRNAT